jgi:hypothetical protein
MNCITKMQHAASLEQGAVQGPVSKGEKRRPPKLSIQAPEFT